MLIKIQTFLKKDVNILWVGGSSLLLFVIIGLLVTLFPNNLIDLFVQYIAQTYTSIDVKGFFFAIANSYKNIALYLILVVVLIMIRKLDVIAGFFIASAATSYLTGAAKQFFGRWRPDEQAALYDMRSFPSGHTSGAFIIMFLVIWGVYHTTKSKLIRGATVISCATYAILIGLSRIVMNVHWFTDVLGGILLAFAVWCLTVYLVRRQKMGSGE